MSENTEKVKKTSWFKGLKAQFKKIIWPDKKTLVKETVAVIVCSVLLGGIIAIVDALIQYGIDFIVRQLLTGRKVILCQKQNGMQFILIQGMKTK